MPTPPKSVTNVLVGIANMWISPTGTAAPLDTLAFNDTWISPWYHPGYSDKGVTLMFDRKEKRHYVEEIANPVIITPESSAMKVQLGFAEVTLENLMYAIGGGTITTQAPGAAGVIGKKTLKLSEDLSIVQIGFEGKNPQGFFRRVIIPRVVSTGKLKTEFDRSKNKQVFNVEFESICSIEDIIIIDKTANSTS